MSEPTPAAALRTIPRQSLVEAAESASANPHEPPFSKTTNCPLLNAVNDNWLSRTVPW